MSEHKKSIDQESKWPDTGINSAVRTSGGTNWVDRKEAFESSRPTREFLKKLWDAAEEIVIVHERPERNKRLKRNRQTES
jgi:hypothetical protein